MIKDQNEIIITEEESKQCKICNKTFNSNRLMIWHVRKDHQLDFENYVIKAYYADIRPVCLKTGNKLSFKAHKLGPWFSNWSKNNFPRKPHTEESKQKIKAGCEKNAMEKFGVKNVFETDWCKEKSKQTMLTKYGVENIMQSDKMKELFSTFEKTQETIEKTKKTNFEKYGLVTFSSTEKAKCINRKYNFDTHYKTWDKYIDKLKEMRISCVGNYQELLDLLPIKYKCNICDVEWQDSILIPFCKNCLDKFENARSLEESSLMKWIKEFISFAFTPNKRFNINGKVYEADICFENEKIIIELNGLFWHSEKAGKDRNYHIDKLNALESLGFRVIQIFEDEWLFKTNLIKNKILHILSNDKLPKIFARNCLIKVIDNKLCNLFLEETHIQGGTNASLCYGAYNNDELVAVMTFSPPRVSMGNKIKKVGEYELVRFSTSDKYRIIGIASKMVAYFIKQNQPTKIMSYADRRWSSKNNNLYEKIGFKLSGETKPNYWYVKKYKREYRFNFTKQKLVSKGYDKTKTEWQIMQEIGYDRIWDCGHFKFEMECEYKAESKLIKKIKETVVNATDVIPVFDDTELLNLISKYSDSNIADKLSYKQKIINKDYFELCLKSKGKLYLKSYNWLLLKFIRLFQPILPYPDLEENLNDVINKISNYDLIKVYNNNEFQSNISTVGHNYLKHYFHSFWKSKFKGNLSPEEAWLDDKIMKEVIEYRIGCNDSGEIFNFSLHQLVRGLSARRITVSFFKPLLAAAIYKHYLGDKDNPIVLDPCCGFGGRLLGFKSVYPNGTYIGCEPNIETYNELLQLVKDAGWKNVLIHNIKFEDFRWVPINNVEGSCINNVFDLLFTSIPYYDVEVYSNNIEYKSFDDWKTTFISSIEKFPCVNRYINTADELSKRLNWNNIDSYIILNRSHFDNRDGSKKEVIIKL